MDPEDLKFIAELVSRRSGLVLTPDKTYLVESRLAPLARKKGMRDIPELVRTLRKGGDRTLEHLVTDAMTTNETFFFRDGKPFDMLRDKVLPEVMERRAAKKSLRIWCAAASTGQEPYSIAILLKELGAKLDGWRIEIVATDISSEAIARAKAGHYSQFEVQRGLPIQTMVKYFKKTDEMWAISQDLKSMVSYREFNLLEPFRSLGQFDVVFCRNVLIYFTPEAKADILERIRGQMPDDGYLFLGGAETVLGITDAFKLIPGQRGVYAVGGTGT